MDGKLLNMNIEEVSPESRKKQRGKSSGGNDGKL